MWIAVCDRDWLRADSVFNRIFSAQVKHLSMTGIGDPCLPCFKLREPQQEHRPLHPAPAQEPRKMIELRINRCCLIARRQVVAQAS